eukprot:919268-Rhodomonas_salina.4
MACGSGQGIHRDRRAVAVDTIDTSDRHKGYGVAARAAAGQRSRQPWRGHPQRQEGSCSGHQRHQRQTQGVWGSSACCSRTAHPAALEQLESPPPVALDGMWVRAGHPQRQEGSCSSCTSLRAGGQGMGE